jgi:hypothetical protein
MASYPDDIIHGDENNPEGREHEMTVDCWCKPVRQRYNELTQVWEIWDRDLIMWTPVEGETPPEKTIYVPEGAMPMPSPGTTPDVIEPMQPVESLDKVGDEMALREAMRVEDDFWRGVD